MISYVTVTIWSIFCDNHSKNRDQKTWTVSSKGEPLVTISMKTVAKRGTFYHSFHPDCG